MRPRLTVAEAAALLAVVAFLFTTTVGNAAVARHDKPVPILMYHVIATPPAGVAFPDLFVRPGDFAAQMHWLAVHGYHAVTLHRVYEYWLRGTPLPSHPIVLSFDDGYLGQHTHAMPVLHKLHWPGVLNLKVNALKMQLERMFHVPVEFFCYPSGRYDARVVAAVRRAGYLGATTTNYGLARPRDIYTLGRIRINGSDRVTGFVRKLKSLH